MVDPKRSGCQQAMDLPEHESQTLQTLRPTCFPQPCTEMKKPPHPQPHLISHHLNALLHYPLILMHWSPSSQFQFSSHSSLKNWQPYKAHHINVIKYAPHACLMLNRLKAARGTKSGTHMNHYKLYMK